MSCSRLCLQIAIAVVFVTSCRHPDTNYSSSQTESINLPRSVEPAFVSFSSDIHSPPFSGANGTSIIQAGQPINISYSLGRPVHCPLSNDQGTAKIQLFYGETNQHPQWIALKQSIPGNGLSTGIIPPFTKPINLNFWVHISKGSCEEWDSNGGQNFQFSIFSPRTTTITFGPAGTAPILSPARISAGSSIVIKYHPHRLEPCVAGDHEGNSGGHYNMGFQFDNNPAQFLSTTHDNLEDDIPFDAFGAPLNAKKMSLWFETISEGGCRRFDSQNGVNYQFVIGN